MWAEVFAAALLILAAGDGLLAILGARPRGADRTAAVASSFGAGVALIATWSLLLALAGVRASFLLLASPALLLAAGRIRRRRVETEGADAPGTNGETATRRAGTLLFCAAAAVVLFQLLYVFHFALLRPVHGWDAWRIWSFKAKVIFLEHGFPDDFFTGHWAGFAGYPLGIPFVESFLARAATTWDDTAIKLLFPLFYAGTLILFARLLHETGRARAVPLGLLLLAPAPLLVHHGAVAYMDLPLAFFLLGAVTWLTRWERKGDPPALSLAALFAGFLPQIKNEGLPLFLLLTALFFHLARRRGDVRKNAIRWFALSLPFCLPWLLFKYGAAVPDSPYHHFAFPGAAGAAVRAIEFARLTATSLFLSGSWGIAWYPLLLFPFFRRRKLPAPLLLTLAGGFLLFASAYAFTDSYTFLENGTALGRNLLVLLPLGTACGMCLLWDDKRSG